MISYIQRHIGSALLQTANTFPVVIVTGPRQVGKSTLLLHEQPNATYVTLDRLDALDSAKLEPERFLSNLKRPLIIDEVQYAPDLLRYIKIDADRSKTKGSIFLTGSQRFSMMQGIDESLAGRAGVLEMLGLSLREIRSDSFSEPFIPTSGYVEKRNPKAIDTKTLWDVIFRGDLPELTTNTFMNPNVYYPSYIDTYLRRDVRDLAHVGDLAKFNRFLGILARLHGRLLNKSDLANRVDISFQTADRWLSILEASSIIYLLHPFFSNSAKRLTKTPKLYFLNSGIAASLSGYRSAEELESSDQAGAFLEGFVITEILKSFMNADGRRPELMFYRDSNGKEIDLIIEHNSTLYPIEIKKAEIARPSDAKAFADLDRVTKQRRGEGAVVCLGSQALPLCKDVWSLPISYL